MNCALDMNRAVDDPSTTSIHQSNMMMNHNHNNSNIMMNHPNNNMMNTNRRRSNNNAPVSMMSMNSSAGNSTSSSTLSATFPMKLHSLLSDSELLGFDDVVCWLPGGQAFKVLDPERFAEHIMPQYFNQTKYKSFQRQLNIYGFQRVHHGPHKGGYTHKFCIQGHPELCERIKRESTVTSSHSMASAPSSEQKTGLFHKRVISWDAHDPVSAAVPAKTNTQTIVSNWNGNAEGAMLYANNSMTGYGRLPQKQQQQQPQSNFSSMYPAYSIDPTPLPFSGVVANKQVQPTTRRSNVLDDEDIAFFKTLFQPGDLVEDKQMLDTFFLDGNRNGNVSSSSGLAHTTNAPQSRNNECFDDVLAAVALDASNAAAALNTAAANSKTAIAPTAPLVSTGAVSEYNFPRKLYRLLEDCETNPEFQSIVSWSLDGQSFKVHNKKRFVDAILPNYFDQSQYASFRRQLNMYSFQRQSMSTYSNPFFIRGRRDLLNRVVRKNGSSHKR